MWVCTTLVRERLFSVKKKKAHSNLLHFFPFFSCFPSLNTQGMSFRLLQSVSYTHVQLLQSVYIIDRQRGENSSGRYLEVIIGKLIWGDTGEWQLIVYLLCCCDARRKAARLHLEHLYNKKKHRHTYTYIYVCTHTHLKATAPAWDMWGIPTEPCWSSRGK